MRLIKDLQRRRLMAITLAIGCAMIGAVALWQSSRLSVEAASVGLAAKPKQSMQERVRRGVGSEVQFASVAAKPEEIDEAVSSTADFIYSRSGVRMSDGMKQTLADAESNVLNGNAKYLTIEELTDNMTAAVSDRLANITDQEIRQAADFSSDEDGQIWARVNGKLGVLTQTELIQQVKAGREWSKLGDSSLRIGLRSMIEDEVNDRVNMLDSALPEQFGQARAQGITPLQALLIAYSVAAEDPLTDSRSDIRQMLVQKRIDDRQTREQRLAQKNVSGRPYGPHGLLHPSDPSLFFKGAGVFKILSLTEGGKK
ncbi:MAG TPA: hypothetical protein VI306_08135 [Pyrinomonadaceae bacterium]